MPLQLAVHGALIIPIGFHGSCVFALFRSRSFVRPSASDRRAKAS